MKYSLNRAKRGAFEIGFERGFLEGIGAFSIAEKSEDKDVASDKGATLQLRYSARSGKLRSVRVRTHEQA